MKKIIKWVALALVVLILGVLVVASTKPDTMHVDRTVTMKAPAARIFPQINDFHNWSSWSPYDKLDPAMKRTYSGPTSGKGAVYEWQGNSQVGSGRMEITDTSEPSKIVIKLDFIEPFEGHNTATFTMRPTGDSTTVTWAMDGPSPLITKVMGVFIDMDKMIGTDFAKGLENLKAVTER